MEFLLLKRQTGDDKSDDKADVSDDDARLEQKMIDDFFNTHMIILPHKRTTGIR